MKAALTRDTRFCSIKVIYTLQASLCGIAHHDRCNGFILYFELDPAPPYYTDILFKYPPCVLLDRPFFAVNCVSSRQQFSF